MRFPEFTGEWKMERISGFCTILKGNGISKEQLSTNGNPCILYGELYTKYKSEIISKVISRTELETKTLVKSKANDVIIPCSGETAIDIATARCVPYDNILLGGDLNILRSNKIDGTFLAYELNGKRKFDIAKVAQGVSVVHLYGEHLKNILVSLPSIEEQQKISRLLNLLDERIATQNKIISNLKSLIKGITQKRQRDGLQKGTWEKQTLSDVLIERAELNEALHPVHSVSVTQGVVNQIEYLGRSFAAKDTSNYHVARYGNIIYTKSPTGDFPYGIVKRCNAKLPAAISPLYGVFDCISDDIAIILHYYFASPVNLTNYLHPLIQKGAKNTINITNSRFLENSIALPTSQQEAKRVARLLEALQRKIDLEENQQYVYSQQKQHLLLAMFI